jgi:hypothetical protein
VSKDAVLILYGVPSFCFFKKKMTLSSLCSWFTEGASNSEKRLGEAYQLLSERFCGWFAESKSFR